MEMSAIILAVVQLISLYETSEQHLQRVKSNEEGFGSGDNLTTSSYFIAALLTRQV